MRKKAKIRNRYNQALNLNEGDADQDRHDNNGDNDEGIEMTHMADEVFEQGRSQRLHHVEARQIKWRIKSYQT